MNLRDDIKINQFVNAARQYCSVLESAPSAPENWLEDILQALSSLYANAHILPEYELEDDLYNEDAYNVTTNEIQTLMGKIMDTLKEQNWYWAYFDPSEPKDKKEELVMGNIADDLTDIYCDIKPGLKA